MKRTTSVPQSRSPLGAALLLAAAICASGCLDEIDLSEGERPDDGIVVQAVVAAGDAPAVEVNLERVFQFEGSNLPDRVPGARVTVRNSLGEELELRFNTADGRYLPEAGALAGFTLEAGLGYSLTARLPDGRQIESEEVRMIDTPPPIRVRVEATTVERVVGDNPVAVPGLRFAVDAPLREGEARGLRWTTAESYRYTEVPTHPRFIRNDGRVCYVVQREVDGSEIRLVDLQNVRVDTLRDFEVADVVTDFRQREGYVLSVVQEALSERAFTYFEQIDEAITREASLFEPPPGVIASNLRFVDSDERVYGFFQAVDREIAHVYVPPDASVSARCPLPPTGSPFPAPNACDDCVQFGGAQLGRPAYFPL